MDFVRYADSLRAKLHIGGVKPPVMIGITAAVLVVLARLRGSASLRP